MGNDSNDSIVRQFDGKEIRAVWVPEKEDWYFSVVDIIGVLTESANPTDCLKKMRKRDATEVDMICRKTPIPVGGVEYSLTVRYSYKSY